MEATYLFVSLPGIELGRVGKRFHEWKKGQEQKQQGGPGAESTKLSTPEIIQTKEAIRTAGTNVPAAGKLVTNR